MINPQVLISKTEKKEFKIGSLIKSWDRKIAAKLIAKGEVAGVFNRGVCALWFDGANLKSVKKIWRIKGEGRRGKTFALTLSLDEFIRLIDLDKIHQDIKGLLSSKLKQKIGSLCFIRAPLKDEYQNFLPRHAKTFDENGVCMIQNWDSFGHTPTQKFLNEVKKLGVVHPAVTSMNITGEKEIVNQYEGEKFCIKFGIPIFLRDPSAHPKHIGSYTIFTFNKDGIKLERDGNIPGRLFQNIFDLAIDMKSAKPPNHPQLKFPSKMWSKLSPIQMRTAILYFLSGKDPNWISKQFKNN